MEPKLLRRIRLGHHHAPTGLTRHFCAGELLPPPVELKVVQYTDDCGFYLFYCDETGNEQADTWHESLEQALDQAEFEFGVKPREWAVVNEA